jgi:hypothetical protein
VGDGIIAAKQLLYFDLSLFLAPCGAIEKMAMIPFQLRSHGIMGETVEIWRVVYG